MRAPFRRFQPREPQYRRNGKIRAREVRVIDEARKQLGVMALSDALRLATTRGMDLVEIVPNATPPVCRIIEYGKFQYEQAKKGKESRNAGTKMKEIQLSANIDPHDFATKRNHAIDFLCDDMKVRVRLRFRGRQKAHKEVGFEVMNRFLREVSSYGHCDAPPKMAGDRDLGVLISPLAREKRAPKPRSTQAKENSSPPPQKIPASPQGEPTNISTD
jgi:translation initiation factor IF-3